MWTSNSNEFKFNELEKLTQTPAKYRKNQSPAVFANFRFQVRRTEMNESRFWSNEIW